MVRNTPPSQDVSTHQIWNSYLKEYRRYGPDTKAGRTDGPTDGECDYICLPKFLWGHNKIKVCAIIYHPATSFYHIAVLKKPEQTVFSNFVRRGRYSVFTCQGMMSRSMYCKSFDERLLEIAGIGFLIYFIPQAPTSALTSSRKDVK